MRYLTLLATELRQVRANVPYVILTIITPVMFMALFVFMIRGDITLPVTAHPDAAQSSFVKVLASNRAPDNPLYFQVAPGTATPPAGKTSPRSQVENANDSSSPESSPRKPRSSSSTNPQRAFTRKTHIGCLACSTRWSTPDAP